MQYVLSIGNYLNGGTPKGGAHGVLFKSLVKLLDARGRDRNNTLLHFLIRVLRAGQENDALTFHHQIGIVGNFRETSVKVWCHYYF